MRSASDGKSCCTACIAVYELGLNSSRAQNTATLDTSNTPIITSITHRHTKP